MKHKFKPGNLVRIEIHNFRSISHLCLNFTPHVNYFLAPNGHGKSSILMAIQLVLGSTWGELKQTREQKRQNINNLIKIGEDYGEIKLYLCKQAFQYDINQTNYNQDIRIDVIRAELAHKGINFFYNNKQQTQEELRLKVRKLNLYVDNPFTSMMQLEAQKVMYETAYNKLRYVLQLMGKENDLDQIQIITSEIREQNTFKRLQEDQNQFKHKKQLFQQGLRQYRQENQLRELKSIAQQLDILYFCISLIDLCKQIKFQQNEVSRLNEQIQAKQNERIKLGQQMQTFKDRLEELEQRKAEQFRQMRAFQQHNDSILKLVKQNQIDYNSKRQNYKNIKNMLSNQTLQYRENLQQAIQDLEAKLQEANESYNNIILEYENYYNLYQESKKDAQSVQLNQIQQQIDAQQRKLMKSDFYNRAIQNIKAFQAWYMHVQQKHAEYFNYSPENKQFLIFPVIKYLYVKEGATIPESTCKYILINQLGNNFMNILTNSFQLLINISHDYGQFNQRNRASSVNQLGKLFEGKSYEEAVTFSQTFLNAQANRRPRLATNLRDGECKFFIDAIDGNPIVLQYFYSQFSQILYINQATLQDQLSDHELELEINNILKQNPEIKIIFTEKYIFTKILHEKRIAAINQMKYDVNKISDELKALVQNKEDVVDDLEIKQKITELKNEYNQLQQQLNTAELKKKTLEYQQHMEASNAQKMKTKHYIQNLKDEIAEKKNELQSYRYTVTEADLRDAKDQMKMKLNDLKKYIMKQYNINIQILQLIFSDDNTIAESQYLDLQIKSLDGQIATIQADEQGLADNIQRTKQHLTAQISNFNSQNNTYQLHRTRRQSGALQAQDQHISNQNQISQQEQILQSDLNKLLEQQDLIDKMVEVMRGIQALQLHPVGQDTQQDIEQQHPHDSQQIKTVITVETSRQERYNLSATLLGRAKDHIFKQIKSMQGRQTQNLPLLQQELKKLIHSIIFKYAFILNVALRFIELVNVQNKELKQFVNQISAQLVSNLKCFGVAGHLELKLWTGVEYQAKFNHLVSFLSDFLSSEREDNQNSQQQQSQTRPGRKKANSRSNITPDVTQTLQTKFGAFFGFYTTPFTEAFASLRASTEDATEEVVEMEEEEVEIFGQKLDNFRPQIEALDVIEALLLNFAPGISVSTTFAKGERLRGVSLSGGEKSVVALCLAGSCQQSPLVLIDEINQGMDEIFETAAHQLVLSFTAQTLISSPKLTQHMNFDIDGHVAVHILMLEEQ